MGFAGFTADTLRFIEELAEHNDSAWFAGQKSRYEREVLEREKAFVGEAGEAIHAFAPHVVADPRVNGSIFRIRRDTRFSRDKSPFKTYVDMWFWEGYSRKTTSGFFVRIVPDAIWTGAGAHMLDGPGLEALRIAVAGDDIGPDLAEAVEAVTGAGYTVAGDMLKRVPHPFPADHPREELLRHKTIHALRSEPVPDEFYTSDFIGWCADRWRQLEPLHSALSRALGVR
jgi:uncharacterized protein (TIGR02453 family)